MWARSHDKASMNIRILYTTVVRWGAGGTDVLCRKQQSNSYLYQVSWICNSSRV